MKELLGEEFDAYLESFSDKRIYGLRVNNLKISTEDFFRISPFKLTPVPWIENGFFYEEEEKPAKHPYYFAGLYYLQEPSAMTPANLLPVEEGDYILDMCAAPGGKSTELSAKLSGTGLLFSNDVSASRAKALLKNIELFGVKNVMITSEPSSKLRENYGEFFDKILIDAPCSGEGMFRKDSKLVKAWEKNGPKFYGDIQREIILDGADMLKPGGYMMYSTCTFSKYEDEETIAWLLEKRPEMELVGASDCYEGFSRGFDGMEECIRIFPHKMQGEGHFLALLHKREDFGEDFAGDSRTFGGAVRTASGDGKNQIAGELADFLEMVSMETDVSRIRMVGERAYLLPEGLTEYGKLHILRAGLLLGEVRKNRFEPSQAFAMALKKEEFRQVINLACDDINVIKYLKGETIEMEETAAAKQGWNLVCVDGFPLGWGKLTGNTLKNKYHPGWRWQ